MSEPRHFVAVVGGAVSGSVAAEILAEKGVEVAVIEQNNRPYGKIEDGLPRWHVHQRKKEYEKINSRLSKPNVHFVPNTKLGRDLAFDELRSWGLSAILLANGAWRDRPLPIPGADEYLGKGIEYQNPFVYWFNHKPEKDFDASKTCVPDSAIVVGGGLASIDVVKICQLEIYDRALKERGIEVDVLEMEKKGIPAICGRHGIDPADLGLENTLLLYRRRNVDMPLAQEPPRATPEQKEKTQATRKKLLGIAQQKFLFRFQDKTLPNELVIEDGRVAGVKVQRTEVEGRKATPVPGTEQTLRTGLIIGSIGSIPEPIEGIRMNGQVYDFQDWDLGVYDAEQGIFGVGNVVTGQGNIRKSLLHAQEVCAHLTGKYLGGVAGAGNVQEHLDGKEPLHGEKVDTIRGKVRELQARAGYGGDYAAWIERVVPADLA